MTFTLTPQPVPINPVATVPGGDCPEVHSDSDAEEEG
jgi:hypothetical protein